MTLEELSQKYKETELQNIDIKLAFEAGFKQCVEFIEQTFKNKQIMLSLKSIISNQKSSTSVSRNTNTSDMVIKKVDGKPYQVTLSNIFFTAADLQNHRIMVAPERADNSVYFIVHKDESLYSDFLTGKRLPLKDQEGADVLDEKGKKMYSDEIGKKTNTFQDKKTGQDLSLFEILETYTDMTSDVSEFNLVSKPITDVIEEASEFNIHSVWKIENKKDVKVGAVNTTEEAINNFENSQHTFAPLYSTEETESQEELEAIEIL